MSPARARIIRRAVAQFCKDERVPDELQHRLYRRVKRHWSRHKQMPGFFEELRAVMLEVSS